MTQSIAQLTQANIHYHTGIFTCAKTTLMTTSAFAGITALVIGILALWNFVTLPYGNAAYYLVAGGSLTIQGVAIALVVLARKNSQVHYRISEFLKDEAEQEAQWWADVCETTLQTTTEAHSKRYTRFMKEPEEDLFGIFVSNETKHNIHFFTEKKAALDMVSALHFHGFEFREWKKEDS